MKSADKCPSFTVISLSADGDVQAIEKVLKHYDAYISKASLRPLYDEYGNIYISRHRTQRQNQNRSYGNDFEI